MENFNFSDELSFRDLLKRLFFQDWLLKIIALVITLALWLSVGGLRQPVSKRLSNVQLSFSYPSDMELINSSVKEVDLILTGDKSKIEKLRREDLVIVVDLSGLKSGDKTVRLSPENIDVELPSGVKIEEIQPSKISVRLERLEEKEVSVKPEFEGNPAKGFEIYDFRVFPSKVVIRGPESYVRAVESVSTEKISVENREESFTAQNVSLNVINPKIRTLETEVNVNVIIGEKRIEKVFRVPYEEKGIKQIASVTLFAPQSMLEDLQVADLKIKKEAGQAVVILPQPLEDKIQVKSIKLK